MFKLTPKLFQSLLEQCEREFMASNSYFHCANWLDFHHYPGLASYFKAESGREHIHAKDINDFILKRGELPNIFPFKNVNEMKFNDVLDVFVFHKTAEMNNMENLNKLAQEALEEKDLLTLDFLNKFLREQLDSCNEAENICRKAHSYNRTPALYYHLDRELGKK